MKVLCMNCSDTLGTCHTRTRYTTNKILHQTITFPVLQKRDYTNSLDRDFFSPQLKIQVSFSIRLMFIIQVSMCVCKPFVFSSSLEPLGQFCIKRPSVKGFQFSNVIHWHCVLLLVFWLSSLPSERSDDVRVSIIRINHLKLM